MRRTGPLIVICLVGAVLLFMRLAKIQIKEHEIWAAEAARMVRSGSLVNYRRGAIIDGAGQVMVRDEATYTLELSYRSFRRGHPLGLLAHARSSLVMRPVPLALTWNQLENWSLDLVRLSPTDLDRFGEGAALEVGDLYLPACETPESELRAERASDLRFYTARLLGLTPREGKSLRSLRHSRNELPSYLALVAEWRGLSLEEAREALLERLGSARIHLELFASRLGFEDERLGDVPQLIAELERVRSVVDGLCASGLFAEAAGFAPGRVDPNSLYRLVDLSWIALHMRWDDQRLHEWLQDAHERWLSWRNNVGAQHLTAEFFNSAGDEAHDGEVAEYATAPQIPNSEHWLDLLSALYREDEFYESALDGQPLPWQHGRNTAVLGEIDSLFDLKRSGQVALPSAALWAGDELEPVQEGMAAGGWERLAPLAKQIDPLGKDGQEDAGRRWRLGRLLTHLRRPASLGRYDLELLSEVLLDRWEANLQRHFVDALETLHAQAKEEGRLTRAGRLRFAPGRLARALESLRDILRDYGDRPLTLLDRPDYELVYLLTRFPERYKGMQVREASVRVREPIELDGAREAPGSERVAAEVLGTLSVMGALEVQMQREREKRLAELRSRERTPAEDNELDELIGDLILRNESRGVSGLEGEWDDVLRGRNGYREHRGLEDVYGQGLVERELSTRLDGRDIHISLLADFQRATELMLEQPRYDPTDELADATWFNQPVGAIVLVDMQGRIIVQASVPNSSTDLEADTSRLGGMAVIRDERRQQLNRTMRKPLFQPPGSVFKPFVAAWALEHGLDENTTVMCEPSAGDWANYGGVHCWDPYGHGRVDLSAAIKGSCNSYFAWVGETSFPHVGVYWEMARSFGYGRPTGIRRREGGSGLTEDYVPGLFSTRALSDHERRQAANGLAVVEATPCQVARAFLALATGELRELSLVDGVGDELLPLAPPEPLGVSRESLELVRQAMWQVSNERGGTAQRVLNEDAVGMQLVIKTGSADLARTSRDSNARKPPKHTWVAGWFPAQDPVAVFTVFLDRTRSTSSHSAVYVARQFLSMPETRKWIRAQGVHLEPLRGDD